MFTDNTFKRLRAALKQALVWGAGWSGFALSVFAVLRLLGFLPASASWAQGFFLAARFGIVGAVSGAAFSTVVGLAYRGRRLRDINWVRFGIAGAVVTGVFVPLFLQAMNVISGDGLVPWRLVLDDGVLGAVFGGLVAAGSLKLAQRGVALPAGNTHSLNEPSMSSWMKLANFASGLEADMAVETLRSQGIPAQSRGNDITGVVGPGFQGKTARGVDVVVPSTVIKQARDILGLDESST